MSLQLFTLVPGPWDSIVCSKSRLNVCHSGAESESYRKAEPGAPRSPLVSPPRTEEAGGALVSFLKNLN